MSHVDRVVEFLPERLREAGRTLAETACAVYPDASTFEPRDLARHVIFAMETGLRFDADEIILSKYRPQRQVGYKGILRRVRETGRVTNIVFGLVYANELRDDRFAIDPFATPPIRHNPIVMSRERGDIAGAYCTAKIDGEWGHYRWMDIDELQSHRARYGSKASKPGQTTPWDTEFGQMSLKTVIKAWAARAPVPPGFLHAINADDDDALDDAAKASQAPDAPDPLEGASVPRAASSQPAPQPVRGVEIERSVKGFAIELVRLYPAISDDADHWGKVKARIKAIGAGLADAIAILEPLADDARREVIERDNGAMLGITPMPVAVPEGFALANPTERDFAVDTEAEAE